MPDIEQIVRTGFHAEIDRLVPADLAVPPAPVRPLGEREAAGRSRSIARGWKLPALAASAVVFVAAGVVALNSHEAPTVTVASEPAATSSAAREVGATIPYDLYTHCGIREALIDKNYYVASPVLDDGNGNPPKGWGNPDNSGTMTVNADKTADFHDAAGHRAHFVLRPGAATWLQICS